MTSAVRVFVAILAIAVCSLVSSCVSPPAPGEPPPEPMAAEYALGFLRGAAAEAIATVGTEVLRKHAPDAIGVIDRPGPNGEPPDGRLTFAECEALVTAATPEELGQRFIWLGLMAAAIAAADR